MPWVQASSYLHYADRPAIDNGKVPARSCGWYVERSGVVHGPLSTQHVIELAHRGSITTETKVLNNKSTQAQWIGAGAIPFLHCEFSAPMGKDAATTTDAERQSNWWSAYVSGCSPESVVCQILFLIWTIGTFSWAMIGGFAKPDESMTLAQTTLAWLTAWYTPAIVLALSAAASLNVLLKNHD